MTPTPKRRWFAYSLRTLFVVVTVFSFMAALAAWLGGQRHVIQERRALQAWFERDVDGVKMLDGFALGVRHADIPTVRRWLGDTPQSIIVLQARTPEKTAIRVRRYFPEAEVYQSKR